MLRKIVFWVHLAAGLLAGVVIAVMSFTGAALAFEKELVSWSERDVRHVEIPNQSAQRVPLKEVLERMRELQPEARPSGITVYAEPSAAIAISIGRDSVYYANPYTADIHKPQSSRVRDFMHLMESWHRFLGLGGESTRPIGKAITGACNLAFCFLALSGLFLWWPRNWSWRGLKAVAVFNFRLLGRARDFNWHNSVGLWTAPILIVLTLTAIPMSYRWGNALVYRITGTEPPSQVRGSVPNASSPGLTIPPQTPGAKPASYDALLATVENENPGWTEITFRLGNLRGPSGPRRDGQSAPNNSERPQSPPSEQREPRNVNSEPRQRTPQPITVTVRTADQWPLFSTTTLSLDPFTGSVLRKETFADQNGGRRLRSWTRFLHTGEALGFVGKLFAAVACIGALLLVWTGLALSWRRFFPRSSRKPQA
ncbi:MAG: PepSY-associated TM helix domain-containing protein [Nibricoccus sp.]